MIYIREGEEESQQFAPALAFKMGVAQLYTFQCPHRKRRHVILLIEQLTQTQDTRIKALVCGGYNGDLYVQAARNEVLRIGWKLRLVGEVVHQIVEGV